MKTYHYFAIFTLITVFTKWVILPEVNKVDQRDLYKKDLRFEASEHNCVSKGECGLHDLMSGPQLTGANKLETRKYVLSNWKELVKQSPVDSYFLRARIITKDDFSAKFLNMILASGREQQAGFLQGLYSCHDIECENFAQEYLKTWENIPYMEEEVAKLKIKLPGHWSQKNKVLEKLLKLYANNEEYARAVTLIDFIPNHPGLKEFLAKHYLKIIGQGLIDRTSYHLARYEHTWHDKMYEEVMKSGNLAHIDAFLKTMKVSCPQNVDKIFSFWDSWNKPTQSIARNEARYLLDESNQLLKKIDLNVSELVKEAKCRTKTSENSQVFF
jgi:hypothetical protein